MSKAVHEIRVHARELRKHLGKFTTEAALRNMIKPQMAEQELLTIRRFIGESFELAALADRSLHDIRKLRRLVVMIVGELRRIQCNNAGTSAPACLDIEELITNLPEGLLTAYELQEPSHE